MKLSKFSGDEDENWAKRAIENLMKKLLKHNKDALTQLEYALQVKLKSRLAIIL